jgi:Rrf2 family protein
MAKEREKIHTAKSILENLNISDKYLRRIMTQLTKFGFITSVQGKEGGYFFSRKLEDISIEQVISAFEGLNKFSGCILGFDECSDENPCAFHSKWKDFRSNLLLFLQETNLSNIEVEEILKF